jgi:hypothetical protein
MFHKNNSNKLVLYTPRSNQVRGVFPVLARRGLLAFTLLFLIWLAWQAFSGGFRQLARSRTIGQKVETLTQMECGLLSLLVVLTSFWGPRWAQPVQSAWSISLAAAAGLSSLVWGPPMPLIGVLFTALALLVSQAVRWALRTTRAEHLKRSHGTPFPSDTIFDV